MKYPPKFIMPIFVAIFILISISSETVKSDENCVTDTIFLLDSSGSIRKSFDIYRQYVRELIQQMPISPDGHHASLIVYSGRLRQFTKWALDQQPQEKEKLLERVKVLPHLNGATATGVALDVVTQRELPKRRKSLTTRTNLVVLTDGFSYDPVDVESANLHAIPDVRTFAVCLDDINVHSELVTIGGSEENVFIGAESASKLLPKLLDCPAPPPPSSTIGPSENNTESLEKDKENAGSQQQVEPAAADVPSSGGQQQADQQREGGEKEGEAGEEEERTYEGGKGGGEGSADDAKNARKNESESSGGGGEGASQSPSDGEEKAKGGENKMATEKPEPNFCPTDFLIVIDGSGSLRQRFEHQKEMAIELVDALPQGKGIRVGLVKYSGRGKSRVKLPINNNLSRAAIQQLIRDQPFFGGTTFTNEALEKAMGELDKQNGGQNDERRGKKQQVVAVFTDGMSQEDPTSGANGLRGKGAKVYSIAVEDGQPIHMKELELIAGDPSRVFTDKNFEKLKEEMKAFPKNC